MEIEVKEQYEIKIDYASARDSTKTILQQLTNGKIVLTVQGDSTQYPEYTEMSVVFTNEYLKPLLEVLNRWVK